MIWSSLLMALGVVAFIAVLLILGLWWVAICGAFAKSHETGRWHIAAMGVAMLTGWLWVAIILARVWTA